MSIRVTIEPICDEFGKLKVKCETSSCNNSRTSSPAAFDLPFNMSFDMPTFMPFDSPKISESTMFRRSKHFKSNTNFYVDYPVRVHDYRTCECIIVKQAYRNELKRTNDNERIIYIVTKLYNDNNSRYKPKHIFVKQPIYSDHEKDNIEKLQNLFQPYMVKRDRIKQYFKSYQWSSLESMYIRQLVCEVPGICYCKYGNKFRNSGIILFGLKHQLNQIASHFNKSVVKTEFSKLYVMDMKSLQLKARPWGHSYQYFMQSQEYKILLENSTYCTLVGLESETYMKGAMPKLDFSFGKREWSPDDSETSFDCAKRELFEEFNIQISHELMHDSRKHCSFPKRIMTDDSLSYLIYLPYEVVIQYYPESDTIYISKAI